MKRTASGQLVEESVPISQLAGQAGMTAPPTTPGGAQAVGATPQSAAQAGTPNQMQSALRQSTDTINIIQEAKADKRYRSALSAAEQGKSTTANTLRQALGDTGSAVQKYVDKEVQKLATGPTGYEQWKQAGAAAGAAAEQAFQQQQAAYNTAVAGAEATRKQKQDTVNSLLSGLTKFVPGPIVSDAASDNWERESAAVRSQLAAQGLSDSEINSLIGAVRNKQPAQYTAPAINVGPAPTKQAVAAPALPQGMALSNPFTPTDPNKKADLDAAWAGLSDPDPQKRIAAVQTVAALTGKTDAEITAGIDNAIAGASASGIGTQAAKQLGGTAVGDILPELGVTDTELADLLGTTPDNVRGMSLDQLSQVVTNLGAGTSELDSAAVNPLAGAAERADYRELSREASTSGAAAVDAQLESLGTQLDSADTVTFLGKTGTLTDLLSDDAVSEQINNMVADGSWKNLPDTDPLKKFITQYEDVLRTAGESMKREVTASREITEANKNSTQLGGVQLPAEVVSSLLGEISATSRVDINKSPLLSWASKLPAEQQAAIGLALKQNPALAVELNRLSPAELSSLGIGTGGKKWSDFQETVKRREELEKIPPGDIDALISFMFEGDVNKSQATAIINQNRQRRLFGLPPAEGSDILDSDGDGQLDSPEQLRKTASKYAGGSLRDILGGASVPQAAVVTPGEPLSQADLTVLNMYPQVPSNDQVVDNLSSGKLPLDVALAVSERNGPMGQRLREAVGLFRNKKTATAIKDTISKRASGKQHTDVSIFNVLQDLLQSTNGDPTIDQTAIRDEANKLASAAESKIIQSGSNSKEAIDFMRNRGYNYRITGGKVIWSKNK